MHFEADASKTIFLLCFSNINFHQNFLNIYNTFCLNEMRYEMVVFDIFEIQMNLKCSYGPQKVFKFRNLIEIGIFYTIIFFVNQISCAQLQKDCEKLNKKK